MTLLQRRGGDEYWLSRLVLIHGWGWNGNRRSECRQQQPLCPRPHHHHSCRCRPSRSPLVAGGVAGRRGGVVLRTGSAQGSTWAWLRGWWRRPLQDLAVPDRTDRLVVSSIGKEETDAAGHTWTASSTICRARRCRPRTRPRRRRRESKPSPHRHRSAELGRRFCRIRLRG
jgi:hypothetical protein